MSFVWRKLLSNPPPEWARLALLTRGVGNEILRALDADGEIDCGTDDHMAVICRITAAHPKERRRVKEAVEELIAEGWLTLDKSGSRSVIRGHLPDLATRKKKASPKAPETTPPTSPETTRSVRGADVQLTRSVPAASPELTRSLPGNAPNSAQVFNSRPVEEKREEEKREDPQSPHGDGWDSDARIEQARKRLQRGYSDRYRRVTGNAWQAYSANDREIREVAAWAVSDDDGGWSARCDAVLDGFFADSWASSNSWPWKRLAKDPARYLGAASEHAKADKAKQLTDIRRDLEAARKAGDDGRIRALEQRRQELAVGGEPEQGDPLSAGPGRGNRGSDATQAPRELRSILRSIGRTT